MPGDFKQSGKKPGEMNWAELRDYIRLIRSNGVDTTRYVVDLWAKLSTPFICFVLALVGVPYSIRSGRSGGLALGVGMLVDNSIVVLESIFRCREEGDSLLDAAERGTREVASAVTASTLTTIAVFFPIVFLSGISKFLFMPLAMAVILRRWALRPVALMSSVSKICMVDSLWVDLG